MELIRLQNILKSINYALKKNIVKPKLVCIPYK